MGPRIVSPMQQTEEQRSLSAEASIFLNGSFLSYYCGRLLAEWTCVLAPVLVCDVQWQAVWECEVIGVVLHLYRVIT